MQREEMIVTREDQAIALQDVGFLGQFLEPRSPSDVAKKLGMPANLAHHHAKRHAELGLLLDAGRDAGKVYYQLAARTFKHARSLIPAGAPNERVTATLARLEEQFLAAYQRSDQVAGHQDPDWTVYGFSTKRRPRPEKVPGRPPIEARPAHFQVRTFRLSSKHYQQLVQQIARLLEQAEADPDDTPCTLAFLALDGALQAGQQDSHMISSFVPLEHHS